MPKWLKGVLLTSIVLLPASVFAQGSIAGTVKDTSGAVLPGVTIEAASPALIEKTRSVVTDGTGQYKIIDLRPGTYTVTFTLPGFNTVKRDGIELSGSFVATVNADLKVGAVEETITVTGETPIVDVQSTTKERVLTQEIINTVPTGRLYQNLGTLVPGVSGSQDVGGATGDTMANLVVHGSKGNDMRILNNGVNTATLQAGGSMGMATPDPNAAQEVTIDTAAVDATSSTSGVRINYIPRDGGNNFKLTTFASASANSLQSDNFTSRVQGLGLPVAGAIKRVWDINPAFGGPLQKDKIWYWVTLRHQVADNYVGGMFLNANANNPNAWTYVAQGTGLSNQAFNAQTFKDAQIRMTWQATARNKFAGTWDQQTRCQCPMYISATRDAEAGNDRRAPTQQLLHGEWTSPVTSRLLLEAVGLHRTERWGNMPPTLEGFASGSAPGMISVTDQGGAIPNLQYRGFPTYNNTWVPNYAYRAALSYVTGAHAFKAGWNDTIGFLDSTTFNFQNLAFRFNSSQLNGGFLPNQLTEYSAPIQTKQDENHDMGFFAQDKWTMNRLTLTGGIRYDWFNSSFPAETAIPSIYTPNRSFTTAETPDLNWKDIEPRAGAVYDLFGNGKTAVRFSANKYLNGQGLNGLGSSPNPINLLQQSTTRTWTDKNGNFIPDCDLTNTAANGECAKIDSPLFGQNNAAQSYDPNLLGGFGHRSSNWEFAAGVQHQLVPRVSIDIAYFRRVFSNFQVTDSLAVDASAFTQFSVTAPTDSRLPGGGGYTVTGLNNITPAAVGLNTTQIFNTLSQGGSGTQYGAQYEHWNGFDFSINARLPQVLLQGGVSTGRDYTNNCAIVSQVPELLVSGSTITPAQYCSNTEPWLTQVKLSGSYTVPKVDVRVSGSFQSVPGPAINANFVAAGSYISSAATSTLGRSLSSGTSATINLVSPNSIYGERLNQLDLRFGKILKAGKTRTSINVDLYNALNADTVLTNNATFNPSVTTGSGQWQAAQSILTARFVKFGVQFDF